MLATLMTCSNIGTNKTNKCKCAVEKDKVSHMKYQPLHYFSCHCTSCFCSLVSFKSCRAV